MTAFTNIADFWQSIAGMEQLSTNTTPFAESGSIADFWAKVADLGEIPTTTTPAPAFTNADDFWAYVARTGAIPTASTQSPAFTNIADFWNWVAANGAMPLLSGSGVAAGNILDFWMGVAEGGGAIGGTAYETPSYANAGGTGDRFETLPVMASGAVFAGSPLDANTYTIINGSFANQGYCNNTVAVTSASYLEIDFTTPRKFDKIKFYFSDVFNCGVWKVQGYVSGAWVDGSATFTLGALATQEIALSLTGATKLRVVGVSGTSSWDQYWREVEFSLGAQL